MSADTNAPQWMHGRVIGAVVAYLWLARRAARHSWQVGCGSDLVKLGTSKCFPLYPNNRTPLETIRTSG
jgi:hypothetical protein